MAFSYKNMTERLKASTSIDPKTGCWKWLKMLDRDGYPRMKTGSRTEGNRKHSGAHRVSFEEFIGPIPLGMMVDHVCRNRACINPLHLRVVFARQNTLENSIAIPALNSRKTHCKRGHPLKGSNLYVIPSTGYRSCNLCHRIAEKIRRAKH